MGALIPNKWWKKNSAYQLSMQAVEEDGKVLILVLKSTLYQDTTKTVPFHCWQNINQVCPHPQHHWSVVCHFMHLSKIHSHCNVDDIQSGMYLNASFPHNRSRFICMCVWGCVWGWGCLCVFLFFRWNTHTQILLCGKLAFPLKTDTVKQWMDMGVSNVWNSSDQRLEWRLLPVVWV